MKHLLRISLIVCALVGISACAKYTEDAPYDKALRVVLSPAPGNFKANGYTSDGKPEYEAVVKVLEGTTLSNKKWTAKIVDEPSWATFSQNVKFIEPFTDIYSGKSYKTTEYGIALALTHNPGNSRNLILRFTFEDGQTYDIKLKQRGDIPDDVHIATIDDFKSWLANQAEWSSADQVYLDGDIDMSSYTSWTPISFTGTFDGQGHCIYNFVQDVKDGNFGFFGSMSGTLKNVVFGSKDGTTYDNQSKINFLGQSANQCWVGMISTLSGNMYNVKNFVNIDVAEGSLANLYAAPLIAVANKSGIMIEGCENYGDFTGANDGKSNAKEALIGGVLARCNPGGASFLTLKNCKNYGNIISNDPYTTAIGGIIGNAPSGNLAHVEGCENFGNVAINSTVPMSDCKEGYAGGIIGYINSNGNVGTIISGCTNHANLLASGCTLGNYGGIAGRITPGKYVDCVNEGDVTYDFMGTTQKNMCMGGIAAGCWKGGELYNCVNKGNISSNKGCQSGVGGLTGQVNLADGAVTYENCTNEGNVTLARTGGSATRQAVAGILAYIDKNANTAKFTGCKNKGIVTLGAEGASVAYAGGIVAYAQNSIFSANENTGAVTSSLSGSVVGGIVGQFLSGNSDADKSNAAITGTTAGAIAGANAGNISNPRAAGSVNGTAISAANIDVTVAGSNTGTISGAAIWE